MGEEVEVNAFLSRVRIKPASERAMYRLVDTPEQLVKVSGEAMALRSMDIGDIAGSSGLPEDEVRDIVCSGRGKIASVRKVLDALWVVPATLPHPVALAKGVSRA